MNHFCLKFGPFEKWFRREKENENCCATIDPTKLLRHEQHYVKQSWQHLREKYMAIYHETHGQHVNMV